LVERLQVRVLLVLDLDDMDAINRLDEPDFSGLHREGGILEFLDRLLADDPADFPAALGAGIFGMLLGQCGEVGAGLDLGQNVLGSKTPYSIFALAFRLTNSSCTSAGVTTTPSVITLRTLSNSKSCLSCASNFPTVRPCAWSLSW